MARRSKDELLAEFHRLYTVFETLFGCLGPLYAEGDHQLMRNGVAGRQRMLSWLDDGKCTPGQLVSGVQQGLNDLLTMIEHALQDAPDAAAEVLESYRRLTGTVVFDDVARPSQLVLAAVRRGAIVNDTEFDALSELLCQTDQTLLTGARLARANAILSKYERTAS